MIEKGPCRLDPEWDVEPWAMMMIRRHRPSKGICSFEVNFAESSANAGRMWQMLIPHNRNEVWWKLHTKRLLFACCFQQCYYYQQHSSSMWLFLFLRESACNRRGNVRSLHPRSDSVEPRTGQSSPYPAESVTINVIHVIYVSTSIYLLLHHKRNGWHGMENPLANFLFLLHA